MAAWEDKDVQWPRMGTALHVGVLVAITALMIVVALFAYRELMAVTGAFPF